MITVLSNLLVSLLLAVSCGLAADSYVNILTQPGQVLAFWAKWLYALKEQWALMAIPESGDLSGYNERIRIADYILKPILTCVYCVGGQMGFWLSLYFFLQCFTVFESIFLSFLTAAISVWMGGLFQAIQKKYFPL